MFLTHFKQFILQPLVKKEKKFQKGTFYEKKSFLFSPFLDYTLNVG